MSDNKFWQICNKALNILLLGCMWITCCIPVFTIGASTTALNACMKRIVNKEEYETVTYFFACFKRYFKKATLFSLIIVLLLALMVFDFIYYIYGKEVMDVIGQIAIGTIAIILLGSLNNGCARLIDNEDESIKDMLINSFKMCLTCPIETIMVLLINIFIPIGLVLLMKELIVISFGLCSFLDWLILPNALRKFKFKK